jgi:DNA repair protein RadC
MTLPLLEANGPRERAERAGLAALSDADLVALVIGHGVRGRPLMELAQAVLERAGGLDGFGRAGPGLYAGVPGLGHAQGLRLAASVEIGRRIVERAAAPRRGLRTPAAVAAAFTPRIGILDHEEMWVLALDGRQRQRGARRVAQGGRHGLVVTAREILGAALGDGASGIVLVHNHPSGAPEPSRADVEMTHAVVRAADVVGVPLLDHVVVTASGNYASLLDEGLLDDIPPAPAADVPITVHPPRGEP